MRWSSAHPVFALANDLHDVVTLGYDPDEGPEVPRALAMLAPSDEFAAPLD